MTTKVIKFVKFFRDESNQQHYNEDNKNLKCIVKDQEGRCFFWKIVYDFILVLY